MMPGMWHELAGRTKANSPEVRSTQGGLVSNEVVAKAHQTTAAPREKVGV